MPITERAYNNSPSKSEMRSATLLLLALVFALGSALGQVGVASNGTFHIKVTVEDPLYAVIPHAKVEFRGEQIQKLGSTNERGVYEVDLPFGSYSMTVEVEGKQFESYHRPIFRVTSSKTINFDAVLTLAYFCDPVIVGGNGGDTSEEWKDLCGGEDSFPTRSRDGVSFRLLVRYAKRNRSDGSYQYSTEKIALAYPVSVAYNLFSLRADKVTYDSTSSTIRATGHVVAVDESGVTQTADTMAFKMENGRAIPMN